MSVSQAPVGAYPRLARALMVATLVLLLGMLAVSYFDFELYRRLEAEDSLVEWLTFAGLLGVAIVLAWRWWGFRQNQVFAWSAIMLLGALVFVFGAGEEISWGQRIFGFGEGLDLSANRQGETNLHNLEVGGYNLNKLIFTYVLGAGLLFYYVGITFLAPRWPALRRWLTLLGIPVADWLVVGWVMACALVVLAIPSTRKWECLEVIVPASALVILWRRGVVGRGLEDSVG